MNNNLIQLSGVDLVVPTHGIEGAKAYPTQMLQDKLDEANAKIVAQQNEISNAQQTQTILNTLGRFVAWAGSGTPAQASTQG